MGYVFQVGPKLSAVADRDLHEARGGILPGIWIQLAPDQIFDFLGPGQPRIELHQHRGESGMKVADRARPFETAGQAQHLAVHFGRDAVSE